MSNPSFRTSYQLLRLSEQKQFPELAIDSQSYLNKHEYVSEKCMLESHNDRLDSITIYEGIHLLNSVQIYECIPSRRYGGKTNVQSEFLHILLTFEAREAEIIP